MFRLFVTRNDVLLNSTMKVVGLNLNTYGFFRYAVALRQWQLFAVTILLLDVHKPDIQVCFLASIYRNILM